MLAAQAKGCTMLAAQARGAEIITIGGPPSEHLNVFNERGEQSSSKDKSLIVSDKQLVNCGLRRGTKLGVRLRGSSAVRPATMLSA